MHVQLWLKQRAHNLLRNYEYKYTYSPDSLIYFPYKNKKQNYLRYIPHKLRFRIIDYFFTYIENFCNLLYNSARIS